MKRRWHHWEKWECVHNGMYETVAPAGFNSETAVAAYTEFLGDLKRFESALRRVLKEWPISCEQFLSNRNINRIAWLGQSSMCIDTGIPACFRAGFSALDECGQAAANTLADRFLRMWEWSRKGSRTSGTEISAPTEMRARIAHYIETWERRGYENGIPEEVPHELMRLNLAPSYKAIAIAILKNDHTLSSLGYSKPVSPWYNAIKKHEIEARTKKHYESANNRSEESWASL